MPQQKVTIPIQASLRPETLERLTHHVKDVSASDVLSSKASLFFEGLADGGLFLTVDQVQKIEQESKKEIANGGDVVAVVGKSSGFKEGANVIPVTLDPTWMQPLQSRADEAGRTIADLMSDLVDIAFSSDWIYGLIPDHPPVYFSNYKFVQELTGSERPTGAEVELAVRELQKRVPKKKEVAA